MLIQQMKIEIISLPSHLKAIQNNFIMFLHQIIFFLLCSFTLQAYGLKCYSCTVTVAENDPDPDLTCMNDPAGVPGRPIITCPARMKYCTIIRNDYKSTGTLSSMERNCAEKPIITNGDVESEEMISYYRSCLEDLCNKGKGNEAPQQPGGDVGSGAIIVPGVNSASSLGSYTLLLFLAIGVVSFWQ